MLTYANDNNKGEFEVLNRFGDGTMLVRARYTNELALIMDDADFETFTCEDFAEGVLCTDYYDR